MPTRHPPVLKKFPHLLHGGDYNPEQWMSTPGVWDEDMRLMKQAHCNAVSVGIFAWASLEPEEGKFEFGWLDEIMAKLADNNVQVILATPGGAKPAWLAAKYPETLRVNRQQQRALWGDRHNHCFTSPVFREKCQIINAKLAERYKEHPTLGLWHVNNEYSGECQCKLCADAFRQWLRARYENDLNKLNDAWWTNFWSHTITDWSYINPPTPLGEVAVHGHNLDWKRFCTDQTISCFKDESAPLRRITPSIPITTNFMGVFHGLDYYKLAKELDVISWDSYPSYHDRSNDWEGAAVVSFLHAQRRTMLDKPFILMESAPAQQNYKPVCKLKRPGVHLLEGIQAIAHGSESVLYFQWRKSRGGIEKFHGAVVDHYPSPETRIFREVAELGAAMEKLDDVVGTNNVPEVAIIYDYQNRWALEDALGPRRDKGYFETVTEHHRALWQWGVTCDVIDSPADLSKYKLVIAPMLYMLRPGVAENLEKFVAGGGTLVTTYMTGYVNETDLCFRTGFPGPLRKLCGVWAEEIDPLYEDESVPIAAESLSGLSGEYRAKDLCEVIRAEGSEVIARYAGEYYNGSPAATRNRFGKGSAFYIAARMDRRFQDDLYAQLIRELKIKTPLGAKLPQGCTAAVRTNSSGEFLFLMNFTRNDQNIVLNAAATDMLSGERVNGSVVLSSYGSRVLRRDV